MRAVDILRTKRDGGELSAEQIRAFVNAAATGGWPDYQLSALLMAIFLKGMTAAESCSVTTGCSTFPPETEQLIQMDGSAARI